MTLSSIQIVMYQWSYSSCLRILSHSMLGFCSSLPQIHWENARTTVICEPILSNTTQFQFDWNIFLCETREWNIFSTGRVLFKFLEWGRVQSLSKMLICRSNGAEPSCTKHYKTVLTSTKQYKPVLKSPNLY